VELFAPPAVQTLSTLRFGAGPSSQIFAVSTAVHGAADVFAELGEGRALGNPTGTVTAALNGAGALTGAYKYAYYELDVDGNSTGLSPVSATLNPAAQQMQVTVPRARIGVASRVLCRTVAGGSTYKVLYTFGPSYDFNQTIYNDNVADGSLGANAPSSDTTLLYKCSIRKSETFFCAHPDQAGTTHDVGLLTGNPGTAGEWALDAYGTITARNSLGICFYSVHTGTSSYHILADYNSDVVGSTVFSVFKLYPRGEIEMAPAAQTSGSQNLFLCTAPAHTGLTASAENSSVYFNLGATKTFATGALALQREFLINQPIYAFAGASTVAISATFAVTGPPSPGALATLTDSYGILVGTAEATGISGARTLGLFAPGNTFMTMRNTTNDIELLLGMDGTDVLFGAVTNHSLRIRTNNVVRLVISTGGNVGVGIAALATNATEGFLVIPSCAGAPTGVPTNVQTGGIPMVYDSTNHFLYVREGGAWKKSTVYA
jgi:hypothetical protein